MKQEDVESYSWIMRGLQRVKIMETLKRPMIPTQIKLETGISFNNVSYVLGLLCKKDLVTCLNRQERTGRLYVLTERGQKIREKIMKYKEVANEERKGN